MKIIDQTGKYIKFNLLKAGDKFKFNGYYYMKIDVIRSEDGDYYRFVDLINGKLGSMDTENVVTPLDVEATAKIKL